MINFWTRTWNPKTALEDDQSLGLGISWVGRVTLESVCKVYLIPQNPIVLDDRSMMLDGKNGKNDDIREYINLPIPSLIWGVSPILREHVYS